MSNSYPRRDWPTDTAVTLRDGLQPGVMYRSGLTVYDEALVGGRLLGRYWSATGTIKPERHLAEEEALLDLLPTGAFSLRLGDAVLDRNWRWVAAAAAADDGPGTQHVVVELAHASQPATVKVHTRFDGGPFLVRWLEITNTSERSLGLSQVTPFSGLLWWVRDYAECVAVGDSLFALGYDEGSAPEEEGNVIWRDLWSGTTTVEGRNGRSGHGRPSFMLRNHANGETFIGELAWSSNWRYTVTVEYLEQNRDMRLHAAIGPFCADPIWRVIDSGETVTTPRVHLGHLHADLDGCVQALHQHIRGYVLPPHPRGVRLIEANHRGYLIDQESEAGITREIDIAADLGAEVFVVDAGWYGPEPNRWWHNVGDWSAGSWLPNDLYPLVEYAHTKGLLFGLWVEIESIGAKARLRQEHPDWVLRRNGEPPDGAGRHLDVANPAVAAWMEGEIARLITQYKLDLFRLDYNTLIYEGGNRMRHGFVENTLWRHVETIWAMFARLRQRFPAVIFENCASGGGRLDLGLLRYFHVTEITDWMPAPRSLKILNGVTLHLPPEICLHTFGTEIRDHSLYGDLDFLIRTCLFGHPVLRGIAPTLEDIGEPRRSRLVHALTLYKSFIRPLLPDARVYHHTPLLPLKERQPWCVLEYAAADGAREVAGIFRLTAPDCGRYRYRPRGLRAADRYRVTFDNSGETIEMRGLELQRDGLEIHLDSPLTSELLLVERR